VQVVDGVEGEVEHHHVPGLGDVQAAGSDVGAHQVLLLTCTLEIKNGTN
jgi:hypothetical protein